MALLANGAAIRALREAYGWQLTKFAAAVDISKEHLSNLERGEEGKNASPAVLHKIATTLGIPLAAITSNYRIDEITDDVPSKQAV